MRQLQTPICIFLLFLSSAASAQKFISRDYWLLFVDTTKNEYGYKNLQGDVVVKPGIYNYCFTDTFKTYAIVSKSHVGFAAIDRQQKVLYKIFPFDNGPDYISDRSFRILKGNKIGYADANTGKIIIEPRFSCAFPFENGLAKVSLDCKTLSAGEHSTWISKSWFLIDKKGIKVNQIQQSK